MRRLCVFVSLLGVGTGCSGEGNTSEGPGSTSASPGSSDSGVATSPTASTGLQSDTGPAEPSDGVDTTEGEQGPSGEPTEPVVTTDGCWTVSEFEFEFGRAVDVAVAPEGNVTITAAAAGAALVIEQIDQGWQTFSLADDPSGQIAFVANAFDGSGHGFVVYDDFDAGAGAEPGLRFATNASGDWVVQAFPTQTVGPVDADLIVDAAGSATLLLAGTGNVATVADGRASFGATPRIGGFRDPSLAVDTRGTVHGALSREGAVYYSPDVHSQAPAVVLSGGLSAASIAVGPDNVVVMALDNNEGGFDENLWVATNGSGTWEMSRIETISISHTQTAVAADGTAYILVRGHLFTQQSPKSWARQTVPMLGGANTITALAVDPSGRIHVAAINSNGAVAYAVCAP